MQNQIKTQQGFTLIEFMVVLAIAVFTLTAAVPNYNAFSKNNEQVESANALVSTLSQARDEAIKRRGRISVCQSGDGESCGGSGWHNGWIMFVDAGKPGELDGDDVVLSAYGALEEGTSLVSDEFENHISYNMKGISNTSGGFQLCDARGAEAARAICVTNIGRASVSKQACTGEVVKCSL